MLFLLLLFDVFVLTSAHFLLFLNKWLLKIYTSMSVGLDYSCSRLTFQVEVMTLCTSEKWVTLHNVTM